MKSKLNLNNITCKGKKEAIRGKFPDGESSIMKKKHSGTLLEFKETVKNEQLDLDCIIWSWKSENKDVNDKVIKAIIDDKST